MKLRHQISELLKICKSKELTDDETSMKIIDELDNNGLSLRANGWLDDDSDADEILKQANLKINKK